MNHHKPKLAYIKLGLGTKRTLRRNMAVVSDTIGISILSPCCWDAGISHVLTMKAIWYRKKTYQGSHIQFLQSFRRHLDVQSRWDPYKIEMSIWGKHKCYRFILD